MSAIAKQLDLQAITQRITSGEYASHIAQELGISPQILSYHLRKLPDWQDTLETAHEVRLDESDRAIDDAVRSRDFELARARTEQLKRREWRAERECSRRWGTKQQVEVTDSRLVLDDRLGDIADQVINRMRIVEVSPGEIVEVSETETPGP